MDKITAFLQSPAFVYSNLGLQLAMLFVYYRLGRRRGWMDGHIEARGLLEAQHDLVCIQRQNLAIADAHIANLEARLEEVRNASAG